MDPTIWIPIAWDIILQVTGRAMRHTLAACAELGRLEHCLASSYAYNTY